MSKQHVAICEKVALTIEEAAEYSNIGQKQNKWSFERTEMSVCALRRHEKLVKRKEFEKFISGKCGNIND